MDSDGSDGVSKAEFEKSSVELADINRHNLRKGAWHEANFRTIVRDFDLNVNIEVSASDIEEKFDPRRI